MYESNTAPPRFSLGDVLPREVEPVAGGTFKDLISNDLY